MAFKSINPPIPIKEKSYNHLHLTHIKMIMIGTIIFVFILFVPLIISLIVMYGFSVDLLSLVQIIIYGVVTIPIAAFLSYFIVTLEDD